MIWTLLTCTQSQENFGCIEKCGNLHGRWQCYVYHHTMAQMVLLKMVNRRDLYLAPLPNHRGTNLPLQRRRLNGCKHYRRNLRQGLYDRGWFKKQFSPCWLEPITWHYWTCHFFIRIFKMNWENQLVSALSLMGYQDFVICLSCFLDHL